MQALEDAVRSIEQEGLVWGASKLVAVGYGIKKLQITVVVGELSFLIVSMKGLFMTFLNRGRTRFLGRSTGEGC